MLRATLLAASELSASGDMSTESAARFQLKESAFDAQRTFPDSENV
jgi:hypothetical protein